MNKTKPGFKALYFHVLFLLFIGVIGVQTLTSCSDSKDDDDPPSDTSSSSLDGGGGNHFNPNIQYGSFKDSRDNKTYKSVVIGTQKWMAENLNYAGEVGNEVGKCYKDDPANCAEYGRLYSWSTAKTVCPSGWHLPSQAEWNVMTAYIGGESTEGKKLKAASGWSGDGNGTDDYGFSALPGGGAAYTKFDNVGIQGDWWSSNELETFSENAYFRRMSNASEGAGWYFTMKSYLHSVRCLQ